jgi:hypothetical protein
MLGNRYIEIFRSTGGELASRLSYQACGGGEHAHSNCVRMRGLPFNTSEAAIVTFFAEAGVKPLRIHRPLQPGSHTISSGGTAQTGGEAYVEFATPYEAQHAMSRHKAHLGRRYIELFRVSQSDVLAALQSSATMTSSLSPSPSPPPSAAGSVATTTVPVVATAAPLLPTPPLVTSSLAAIRGANDGPPLTHLAATTHTMDNVPYHQSQYSYQSHHHQRTPSSSYYHNQNYAYDSRHQGHNGPSQHSPLLRSFGNDTSTDPSWNMRGGPPSYQYNPSHVHGQPHYGPTTGPNGGVLPTLTSLSLSDAPHHQPQHYHHHPQPQMIHAPPHQVPPTGHGYAATTRTHPQHYQSHQGHHLNNAATAPAYPRIASTGGGSSLYSLPLPSPPSSTNVPPSQ